MHDYIGLTDTTYTNFNFFPSHVGRIWTTDRCSEDRLARPIEFVWVGNHTYRGGELHACSSSSFAVFHLTECKRALNPTFTVTSRSLMLRSRFLSGACPRLCAPTLKWKKKAISILSLWTFRKLLDGLVALVERKIGCHSRHPVLRYSESPQ